MDEDFVPMGSAIGLARNRTLEFAVVVFFVLLQSL
jgi:hypothetical protein